MAELKSLEEKLCYHFQDRELLRLALTHPSITQAGKDTQGHNQRLEFLGDAVLQLALTRALYEKFPEVEEGPLTKTRAQLVNRSSLAEQARGLELGDYLILSRGEEQNGGRQRDSALADAYEAVLGAVFLDAGYEAAEALVVRQFEDVLGELNAFATLENPKGELQELLQAESQETAVYEVVTMSGPDHDREFECRVIHSGSELGRGRGKSKKAAESQAAREALKQKRDSSHGRAQ